MSYQVKVSDVVVSDGLVAMLQENLPSPDKGAKSVVDVGLTFDPSDPADAKWIKAESQIDTALDSAMSAHADAVELDDKPSMAAQDTIIRNLTNAKSALYDNAFGYYTRANGKQTLLKGSLLDRVVLAVNEMNKRIEATGDSVRVIAINQEQHTMKVVREAKAKRTRVLRPHLATIADEAFKAIDRLTATETETD